MFNYNLEEVQKNLDSYIQQMNYSGQPIVILSNNQPIAVLSVPTIDIQKSTQASKLSNLKKFLDKPNSNNQFDNLSEDEFIEYQKQQHKNQYHFYNKSS